MSYGASGSGSFISVGVQMSRDFRNLVNVENEVIIYLTLYRGLQCFHCCAHVPCFGQFDLDSAPFFRSKADVK